MKWKNSFCTPPVITEGKSLPSDFVQLEHPLDFEWRFTEVARGVFFTKIRQLSKNCPTAVLCLGCPSIYASARRNLPDCEFHLWDKNVGDSGQMSEAKSVAKCDLARDRLPAIRADIAVIDPPWYNDFYKLFIWAALQNLRVGGHILLSFPPLGTRPSAADDLAKTLAWCKLIGLDMVETVEGALPYRSPLFEVNALKAEGLSSVPLDWRRGDLIVLAVGRPSCIPRPSVPALAQDWLEFSFGVTRIKIQTGVSKGDTKRLKPVWRSSVLPSVSSRHPARHEANFVTSGNRFLQTCSPDELIRVCGEINNFFNQPSRSKTFLFDAVLHRQMRQLIAHESREAASYISLANGL